MFKFSLKDFEFMNLALLEAKKAFSLGEVPVGAIIVKNGLVIAKAHNLVEQKNQALQHAEVLAIEQATQFLGDWRLVGCSLYSTLEPCLMCAGAAILSRLDTMVWAASDLRHGAGGSLLNVFTNTHPIHTVKVRSGILQNQSSQLLKEFFQQRRQEKEKKNKLFYW